MSGLPLAAVVQLVRGKPGSTVVITVQHAGGPTERLALVRGQPPHDRMAVVGGLALTVFALTPTGTLAYVRVPGRRWLGLPPSLHC